MVIPLMQLRRSFRTYSFRITLLYIALFGIAILLLFAVIYWVTAEFMEARLRAAIGTELSSLLDDFGVAGINTTIDAIAHRVGSIEYDSSYYMLQDASGRKVAGNLSVMPAVGGWYELPVPTGENAGEGSDTLTARGQILSNGWFLVVGRDTDQFTDFEDLIVDLAAWTLSATFVVALIGGLAKSASMLRRVTAITDTGRDIIRGNLARRIELRGTGDEFDRLSTSLNEMLDRIQLLMDGLRQVSNDIAHDLGTPLTRLRQKLDMARTKATTVADYEVAVERAIADTDKILDTFGALLRIAEIEAGRRRGAFAGLDLSNVLQTIVETYTAVAEDQQHVLLSHIADGLTVKGDRQLLTQMIANVVENALRHTPAGTRIEIELTGPPAAPVCTIGDDGQGIPESERRKVFQRFYRLDSSRATPGSGLGLSLVAAAAELHLITVEIDDNEPGLRLIFRFPNAELLGNRAQSSL